MRRATSGETWPWAAIGAAAFMLRRSLRAGDEVDRVTVKRGQAVTIAVSDRDV